MPEKRPQGLLDREGVMTNFFNDPAYGAAAQRYSKMFQRYDPALIVGWLKDKERWAVWTRDRKGNAYMVFTIQTEDGGFRNPCEGDVAIIASVDRARKSKCYSVLDEIEANNSAVEARTRQKMSNAVYDMIRERWRSLRGFPVVPCGISFKGR